MSSWAITRAIHGNCVKSGTKRHAIESDTAGACQLWPWVQAEGVGGRGGRGEGGDGEDVGPKYEGVAGGDTPPLHAQVVVVCVGPPQADLLRPLGHVPLRGHPRLVTCYDSLTRLA